MAARADAIIAAAGSGERLGAGEPKAFVEAAGRPLLGWCLSAFAAAETIDGIVIAAPAGFEERAEQLALAIGVTALVVTGGASRSESVGAAVEKTGSELVAVHDAARPAVTPELIDSVIGRLAESGADCVLAATPVTDTIKQADDGLAVERTVPRSGLWAAQTPQAFRVPALRAALATGDLSAASDDASLVEAAGGRVLVYEAPASNLKVTGPTDLSLAELVLGET